MRLYKFKNRFFYVVFTVFFKKVLFFTKKLKNYFYILFGFTDIWLKNFLL